MLLETAEPSTQPLSWKKGSEPSVRQSGATGPSHFNGRFTNGRGGQRLRSNLEERPGVEGKTPTVPILGPVRMQMHAPEIVRPPQSRKQS